MNEIMQILVVTATKGASVALVALGINIIFATTRIVNFAQGGTIVAAGYIAFLFAAPDQLGLNVWVAFVLTMLVGVGIGVFIDVFAIAPLGGFKARENTGWLVMAVSLVLLIVFWFVVPVTALQILCALAFAVGLGLEVVRTPAAAKFDPNKNLGWIISTFALGVTFMPAIISAAIATGPQRIPDLIPGTLATIAGVPITYGDLLLVVVAVGLMLGIELLLARTMLGRSFHAVSQDRTTASLMGINTGRIVLISFAIAGLLAAVTAVLIAPTQFIKEENSILLSFSALIGAVFGGLGSTRGAIVGSFVVVFVQTFCATLLPPLVGMSADDAGRAGDLVVFVGLLVVLGVKPSGLYGRIAVEKV